MIRKVGKLGNEITNNTQIRVDNLKLVDFLLLGEKLVSHSNK